MVAVGIVAALSAPAAVAGPKKVKLDTATKEQLQQTFEAAFQQTGMPGAAASVWIGKQRWDTVTGVSDLETQAPFERGDNARIASITKSFTATAVLQLVKEKKLKLSDTLEQYVPGIANGDEITIKQILGMRSGIYDFTSNQAFIDAFDADPTMPFEPSQAVDIIKQNQPAFAPGTMTAYADSNYVLLGLVIEKVTGRPVEEVINEDVVQELGLDETTFPTSAAVPEPHPTGYVPDPDDPSVPLRIVNDVNPKVAWTAGAMLSTLSDLKRWGKELTDGSLLTPKLQKERLKYHVFDGASLPIGYGLGVERLHDIVGHNGAIFGYSSVVYRIPEQDATFVVIGNAATNSTTPATQIALELIKQLYPAQVAT